MSELKLGCEGEYISTMAEQSEAGKAVGKCAVCGLQCTWPSALGQYDVLLVRLGARRQTIDDIYADYYLIKKYFL